MSIYKPCDIRGDVAELSPKLYRRWGRCLGRKVDPGALFVVGGDVRMTTPVFLQALIDGLLEAGTVVIDLGTQPTPIVYFAKRYTRAPGCAIVTASHNPPHQNGLKWMIGDLPPAEEDVQALRREAEADTHETGGPAPGSNHIVNYAVREYPEWLKGQWGHCPVPAGYRVVVDPGCGCWSVRARMCLEDVFPGLRCSAIHDEADGAFPGRSPDCARPEHLHRLSEVVRQQRADLGVAFDGDGDRVAFVDNEGHALTAEQATWTLLQSFGLELRGRQFVYDIRFSDRVPETAKQLGARPVAERSGHAFIRTRMMKERALFAAEISGHYFYKELGGGDDGLFTACRIVRYLTETGKTLAELRRASPAVFMTPDLRLPVANDRREPMLQQVRSAFDRLPQSAVDGVRIEFPGGWALVRGSVTEAKITFRFEGDTPQRLEAIVREFCNGIADLGQDLYAHYEEVMNSMPLP